MSRKSIHLLPCLLLLAALTSLGHAEDPPAKLKERGWKVGGVDREAILHVPASAVTTSTPVVFAFHGHGGQAKRIARAWALHDKWPEAIVVYMQGLKTPSKRDPEGGKPGWQKFAGDQSDRDLAFFDAVLETLTKECKVDEKRVFVTGHSNGGGFTYLLWAERGDRFAAVAPSSAGAARGIGKLKPKPALHVAGEKDAIVPFEGQKKTMEAVRELNGCEAEGKKLGENATLYPSKKGAPFVAWVHQGGHEIPEKALEAVVKFFREFETLAGAEKK